MNDKGNKPPKPRETGDEVLKEVWRAKDELSAKYGHDIHRLFEDLRRREKQSGHPIANLPVKRRKVA